MTEEKKLPKSLTDAAAALPDAPPEEFPRPFGGYMLLAPLARGGMGEVFLAKHGSVRGLEKHCVVKTLRPHLTDDREYTTRFIDEARIVVQLGHRNICHVFDVGTVGERYYLAMEYIAGKDLRALTHDVGAGSVMNTGLALHIVCEVLEALDYAHRHTDAATGKPLLLVHRDVSPQNVMLSWEGEVKLIDFGLAASTLKMEQTSPNVVMGKLAYMAPEQVRGERVDGRADLFAAGVLLYEILVGERFYEGRSPYEIWGLAAQGGFRPRRWDALDDDMRAILDIALAAKPDGRQGSCLELREALVKYRLSRALHADTPMLRALMQQVYAKDIEESKKRLVELSRMQPKDPLAARSSGVFSVSTEPTLSIARSPSSSMPVKEGTEPTSMVVKAMFGPRRRVAAAVAGVLVVAGLVALGVTQLGKTSTPANAIAPTPANVARTSTNVPPTNATTTNATTTNATSTAPPTTNATRTAPPTTTPTTTTPTNPATTPTTPVTATTPQVAATSTPGAAPLEAATAHHATAKAKSEPKVDEKVDDKASDAKAAEAQPDAKAADAKAADVKAADAKPADAKDDAASRAMRRRVDALLAKCPNSPCRESALAHRTDFAAITPISAFIEWKAALKKCLSDCGVPYDQ